MGTSRRSSWALGAALLACAACHRRSGDLGTPAPEVFSSVPASAAPLASSGPEGSLPQAAGAARGTQAIREMLGPGVAQQFPLDRVEEETKRFPTGSTAIPAASDFLFVLGQGSGWHGFDTLRIEASGEAVLVFGGEAGGPWRRATFRLTPEELEGLRRELAAIDVFALKRAYMARVDDGTQWFVRVRAGRQRKTVVLDNHFPAPVVRLAEFVRTRIVPPHRREIDEAPRLASHGKLDEPMRWEEDVPAAER